MNKDFKIDQEFVTAEKKAQKRPVTQLLKNIYNITEICRCTTSHRLYSTTKLISMHATVCTETIYLKKI